MKSLLWHIGDAGEYVSKPGARVNAVQLGGLDQAVHGGGALPALVGTRKEPSLPPQRGAAQHALGGVIRQANAAIAQEPRESLPTLQHVIHGLGKVIVARELCPLGTHPCLKRRYQWRDVALAHRKSLSRRLAIDGGFGCEYRVNLAHGLNGEWHVMQLGQLEQFPPAKAMVWSHSPSRQVIPLGLKMLHAPSTLPPGSAPVAALAHRAH